MNHIPAPHATDIAALRQNAAPQGAVVCGFDTVAGFEAIQRMANLLSASGLVPDTYRSKGPNDYTSKGNCVIALDMALRMGANPLMVMQNLYVVHGRPAWSAQFLIATLNKSGKFSALRYAFQGTEGADDWGCRACVTELSTGEKLQGPLVTIGLAKKEGWYGKNGSKWQSMPELMLQYRAAAWFVRTYAPEIAMGLRTAEEELDTIDLTPQADGRFAQQEEQAAAPSLTMADITAQANAAAAGQPQAQTDQPAAATQETARKPRMTQEELDALRQDAVDAYAARGYGLDRAEWDAGRPMDSWTKTDCKRLLRLAEQMPAHTPPQPDDAPAPDAFTCPASGTRITAERCPSCQQRNGCPAWDTSDATA
ncbi:hypothetical protein [uncultured Desulfovibrio sp.]|uniref:hypothetical protein n=1 Tax=uncultured Desulfovibrio sp. TaxID=167968 RepID=UPI00260C680F|nr:hypothetical protein [uncultured Desulfovibrio sp.]